ncbi:outer membrane beta-barrel protein [Marinoscillum sp.]|uniref:outer membrane beta-barrel protein n=1 Tax=Marinoscillum sp. TaxID=2024838 RepID=UPI003BABC306
MKKLIIVTTIIVLTFTTIASNAQEGKINFGLNAATASPLGDNNDILKAGWGVDGSLDYYFGEHFDLGIESGFRSFQYEEEAFENEKFTVVPVLLTMGLHNDLGDIVDLYGELGGGPYIFSSSASDTTDSYGGISPRIGIAVELSDNWFLDTGVDYTHVFSEGTDLNWVGVKFGLLYTIN